MGNWDLCQRTAHRILSRPQLLSRTWSWYLYSSTLVNSCTPLGAHVFPVFDYMTTSTYHYAWSVCLYLLSVMILFDLCGSPPSFEREQQRFNGLAGSEGGGHYSLYLELVIFSNIDGQSSLGPTLWIIPIILFCCHHRGSQAISRNRPQSPGF